MEFGFTVTEFDADRPWIVISREHRTVQLEDGRDFHTWARDQWPEPTWRIDVDRWQLSPE